MKKDIPVDIAGLFHLLSDPKRVEILECLSSGGEFCVSSIAGKVSLSLSATSHQLRKLEFLGIVKKCRYGQEVCYCLDKSRNITKRVANLLSYAKRV